jgi:hypothetical protein
VKHCPNDGCPDFQKYGLVGEYVDGIEQCPKCGHPLQAGAAPKLPEPEWRDLIPVASYRDVAIAHVQRSALEAAGIPAFVQDENFVGLQWTYSQALGGIRLLVPPDRAAEAQELLASDSASALRDVPESSLPPARSELCPHCGSETVKPSGIRRRVKALSLLLGIPLTFWSESFSCTTCSHRWSSKRGAA